MPTTTSDAGASPPLVAFLRSLLILLALAVIGGVLELLTSGSVLELVPEDYRVLVGALLVILVRTLEGVADKIRGQAPQAPLGSAPANPDAYIETTGRLTVAEAGLLAKIPTEELEAETFRRRQPGGSPARRRR